MAKGDSLADQLFNRDTVGQLAGHFDDVGVFSNDPFVTDVMNGLHDLELKARISHIADVLARHLPRGICPAISAMRAWQSIRHYRRRWTPICKTTVLATSSLHLWVFL
ncbi:MAG: hypothetical protein ACKVIA_01720 [Rhodobacterales bacterium]